MAGTAKTIAMYLPSMIPDADAGLKISFFEFHKSSSQVSKWSLFFLCFDDLGDGGATAIVFLYSRNKLELVTMGLSLECVMSYP